MYFTFPILNLRRRIWQLLLIAIALLGPGSIQADLFENFDASTAVPAGWINGGSGISTHVAHYHSPPNARSLGSGHSLQTPLVDFPTNLSFHVDASNAGNGQIASVDYSLNGGGTWHTLASFAVSTAGSFRHYPLTTSPDLSSHTGVRFRFNSTFSTWYLDDVLIQLGQPPGRQPPTLILNPRGPHFDIETGTPFELTVTAIEPDDDVITLTADSLPPGANFLPDPASGPSPLSAVFSWTPVTTGDYVVVFQASDIDGTNEVAVTLSALAPDPTILLFEDFDDGPDVPDGWINGDSGTSANAAHFSSPPLCRALAIDQHIITPAVDFPTNISFYADASNNGDGQTATLEYRINAGPWRDLEAFQVTTAGRIESFPLTQSPNLSQSAHVQFRFASTFNTWYLDDVLIRGQHLADQPPVIDPIGPQMAALDNLLVIDVRATDFDDHEITLSVENAPPGADFSSLPGAGLATGQLTYAPDPAHVGMVFTTTFHAADSDGTSSETITISVHDRLVGFVEATSALPESAGARQLAVRLSRPGDVTVGVVTAGGTATAGLDYSLLTTQLVFQAHGDTTQYVDIEIHADDEPEMDETAIFELVDAIGADIGPNARHVLTILDEDVIYFTQFDTDPGWQREGLWAFGHPLGGRGSSGSPNPTSAYAGQNIFGYNLSGGYPNNIAGTHYLTTTAIDCSRFTNVQISFRRWLGVESSWFDQAVIQASNDGFYWTDVWRHSHSTIDDGSWVPVTYDLSAVADGQSTVYLRWGMGPTDYVVTYCGWNIDDIVVGGDPITNSLFRFSRPLFTARETDGVVPIRIERVGPLHNPANISVSTTDGTATAGEDYEEFSEIIHFAPGESSRTIDIIILPDDQIEGDETFVLYLIETDAGGLFEPATATVIIRDEQSPGASLPFFDGFEATELSSYWTTATNDYGRIRLLTPSQPAFEGQQHLALDTHYWEPAGISQAVLTVDLSGQTNIVLNLHAAFYDYMTMALPDRFSGTVPGSGIAISENGLDWHTVWTPPLYPEYEMYLPVTIDLSGFMLERELTPGTHFQIKFQQYSLYHLPWGGATLDNIQLYDPTQTADLGISVTVSENPVQPDSEWTYTLVVTNSGPQTANAVVVTNHIPTSTTFVAATTTLGTYDEQAGAVRFELGNLAVGSTATLSVRVSGTTTGIVKNHASISSATFDQNRTNRTAHVPTLISDAGGTVAFETDAISVLESVGTVTVTVFRTGNLYGEISVEYATADGTAKAGEDYVAASGVLDFASGQTQAVFYITIIDDDLDEPTEYFTLHLSNPSGGAELGTPATLTLSILDDDGRAPFPFLETFESGTLSNYWRIYSTGDGRIQISDEYGPYDGDRHVLMDTAVNNVFALNELILTTDLEGRQGVTLAFAHKHFGDEPHLMPATFTGHSNSDGVAISADGINWIKVQGLTISEGITQDYRMFEILLDPWLAAHGIEFNDRFQIKFQQYDNFGIPSDGFAFDNIALFSRPGELRFSSAEYSVLESAGQIVIDVERINGSLGEISVAFSTADGTAIAGLDYAATNGILTFADGVSTGSFTIIIHDDDEDEPTETVLLSLSDPTGGALLSAPNQAVLYILDDDGPGTLAFADAEYSVTEADGHVTVTVLRSGGADGSVTVQYTTLDGTATAGVDYVATTGTLFFADGEMQQDISVPIIADDIPKDTQTFYILLSNPGGGASLAEPLMATVRIIDDEFPHFSYYQSAFGKTGNELRTALHAIVDNHTVLSYAAVWQALRQIDADPDHTGQVRLVYKQTGRDAFNNGGNPGQWNREHVWPRSRGFPGTPTPEQPASVDLHHIKPADVEINNLRGNKVFAAGGDPVPGAAPTCRMTATTFEPPDTVKGDIARMMFYMDLRYNGSKDSEPNLTLLDTTHVSGTQMGVLSTLIEWHFQDPPDDFERQRNDLIHSHWQFNRNPFIDYPEWVLDIWDYRKDITTITTGGGHIAPENPSVRYHSDQLFVVQADSYWHIADITLDGQSLGEGEGAVSHAFVWPTITNTGSVIAVFAPDRTARGTPHWWLASLGYTGDFDAAEMEDLDGDGYLNWEEYVAGTNPENAASAFSPAPAPMIGTQPALWEFDIPDTRTDRDYMIFWKPDLTDEEPWQPLQPRIRGTGGVLRLGITNNAPAGFFRTGVATPEVP